MSGSARRNVKAARRASSTPLAATSALSEPFLSAHDTSPGAIVKFHASWATKVSKESTLAAFVCVFEDNVMPRVRPVALNQADLGEMPEDLQAALIMHASKKVVDATANLMLLTEQLYNMYWMTLSIELQQRVIAQEEHAAIKEAFDLLRLKNLVESVFHNPTAGGDITRDAIEKSQSTYQTCCQSERETLAQYYKRFVQTVRQVNGVLPEAMRPTVAMQVTRFLSSLNQRDRKYYARLKEAAALSGNEAGYPVSLEDALVKGARFLLEYYGTGKTPHRFPQQQAATVFSVAGQRQAKPGAKRAPASGPAPTGNPKPDLSHITCFGCGQTGHYRSSCPSKEVNSAEVGEGEYTDLTNDADRCADCFSTATIVRVKADSCAEVSIVGEGFPLENLRDCAPLTVKGVSGRIVVTKVGSYGPIERVYYHPDIPVNILSLGDIERVADIEYEQHKGFMVRFHDDMGSLYFEKKRNTFSCDLPVHAVMDATVAEREKMYTKAELKAARGVREFKRNMAGASDREIEEFITCGVALNFPYTLQDVRRAAAIYGPDIACLKGKMTSPGPERPLVVSVDHGEQRNQELHMDIFEVSGVSFLLTVMVPLQYTFATHLPGKSLEEMTTAVTGLLRLIQSKQFVVVKIVLDPEGGLDALKDVLPVPVNTVAPGTHVPRVERRNRVVKERMRAIINALPFSVAARFMRYLVFFVVTRLGLIPRAADGSRICPRERFTGQKIVFNKELSLCFGDTVQIFSKPAVLNSMEERCFSAMALYPCGNDQGAWKFYKFGTGTVVTSAKWVKVPIQDVQIQALNAMADQDGADIGRGKRARESIPRVRTAPGQVPLERMIVNPHLPLATHGVPDGTVVTVAPPVAAPQPPDEPPAEPLVEAEPDHDATDGGDDADGADDDDEDDDEGVPDLEGESDDEDDVPPPPKSAAPLGSVWDEGGARTSARQAERRSRSAEVYKLTVAQAIDKYGEKARQATLEEFIQMREKTVLGLVLFADLTPEQRSRVIHSSLFLKEKYDDAGELERIKARLVASGNEMDRALYSAGSSPTVATEAVAILLAQSAAYNEVRYFVDIGTAFLEAAMEDEEVYMWISKALVPYLVEAMPEAANFIDEKGRVLVKLLKALYGCIQSSRLWFEHIRDILVRGGYVANDYDPCVFHKGELGDRCSAALHVDDLFITASSEKRAQELLDLLRAHLKEVKVKTGKVNTYLGMRITETDTHLEADMDNYVRDCVEWAGVTSTAKTPADENLFEIDETAAALDPGAAERFHTGTAKLLFVAKRCRPAILTAVSFLCSRVTTSTAEDARKLERVMKYLRGTPSQPIKYEKGTQKMELFAYIDAGYGVHHTGESRSGWVVTLNGTPVLSKTARQKIVTKSSTEAELVALSDGLTDVIWCRQFVQSAGFAIPATPVGEDNTAVLSLLEARKFGTARTKHINVRYFFICDRIANGELVMVYVPTKEQLADINSKALVGHQFQVLQPRLHGDNKV